MKRLKLLLASSGFLLTLGVPVIMVANAQAATSFPVHCSDTQEVIAKDLPASCDLSVDKQVSINGGPFVEADTSDAAASTQVGDTVTYKIVVSNNSSDGLTPYGGVSLLDALPDGITYVSHTVTDGNYMDVVQNVWQLPLTSGGEFPTSTLPATLTITATVSTTGLKQNNISFLRYDAGGSGCPDGGCAYIDGDPSNNSNDAWVNVQTPPQVLASSTVAPDTGFGSPQGSNTPAVLLITLGLLGLAGGLAIRRKLA